MRPASPPKASEIIPVVKVFADGGKHPAVALDRRVCVIGRQRGANLPLPAKQVSQVHALVIRDAGHVYLRDLASTNGVQRNGAPVLETDLANDDVVRIGSYTLRCQYGFNKDQNGVMELPPAELRAGGAVYPFPSGRKTLLIGRRDRCDVRLDDPSVDSVHAILFEMEGKRYVHDLRSMAGTRLNGQVIHRSELRPGDTLQFGSVAMKFVEALTDALEPDAIAAEPITAARAAPEESAELEPLADASANFPPELTAEMEPVEAEPEAVDIEPEPEPLPVEAEPIAIEPEPISVEPELVAAEAEQEEIDLEPLPVEAEPIAIEPEAIAVEPEPIAVAEESEVIDLEPIPVEPEPIAIESEAVAVEPEPVEIEPEPVAVEPEPVAVEPEPIAVAEEVQSEAETELPDWEMMPNATMVQESDLEPIPFDIGLYEAELRPPAAVESDLEEIELEPIEPFESSIDLTPEVTAEDLAPIDPFELADNEKEQAK